MSTIPSVDLGMAALSGIASANISIAAPVLSQNLCYVAIPDSRTGAACVWRSAVGALTPTFPTRSLELELNEEDRNVALGAIADLDKSSKGDDKKDFLEKVEKLSAIAKNVGPLASIVIPLIEVAIKQFLGN